MEILIVVVLILVALAAGIQIGSKTIDDESLPPTYSDLLAKSTLQNHKLRSKVTQLELLVNQARVKNTDIFDDKAEIELLLNEEQDENKKILSQKKSSEVRIGRAVEKLAPLIDTELYENIHRLTFLGSPIDYIAFCDDEIVFYEIKSMASRLSSKQKSIRNLVEDKKIRWKTIRIK